MRFLLITVVLAFCGVIRGQAIQQFVDPVLGIDANGRGSALQPFKTLGYATKQNFAGAVPTFNLRGGVYDVQSGEVFPILLPSNSIVRADPATTVADGQQVVIDLQAANVAGFELSGSGTLSLIIDGLRIEGAFGTGLQVAVHVSGSAVVRVNAVLFSIPDAIEASVGLRSSLSLYVDETQLEASGTAIRLQTIDSSAIQAFITRSIFTGGHTSVVFDAKQGGIATSSFRAVSFTHMQSAGVHSYSDLGSYISHSFENCLFHNVGNTVLGLGAIVDTVLAAGVQPQCRVLNGIFDYNRLDAPNGTHPNYFWGSNIVQQPDLGMLGRNVLGKATFVSPFDDDFHLAPGSLGIDLGLRQHVSIWVDYDGDPRLLVNTVPDLGPDEYYDWYVYAHAEPRLRELLRIRTTTPVPDLPFGLIMSMTRQANTFGAGQLHLSGSIFATMVGTTGKNGVGEVVALLPPDPSLIGLELFWQGGFLAPPYFGTNAWRTVFLK